MITEDYVSFETAKLLKERGFNEACRAFYDSGHRHILKFVQNGLWNSVVANNGICVAPTLQMAMKWLREVHKLFIQICIIPHTTVTIEQKYYLFTIHKDRRMLVFRKDFPSEYYFTYEEACEAAIKYCLENLI